MRQQSLIRAGQTMDYEKMYRELREVHDDPRVKKAIRFAHEHPEQVYGEGTEECQSVRGGFFSLYFIDKTSRSWG